jgi:hypothetical protein
MSLRLEIRCSTPGCQDFLNSTCNIGVDKDYIDEKRRLIKEWISLGGTFREGDNHALCPPCVGRLPKEETK